ncbi:hypothetical protein ACJJTC_008117 [Scirpophaga incertulas]
MNYNILNLCLLCLFNLKLSWTERLQEQIYSSIEGGAPCFRRLNGTHQMGCSSEEESSQGVVHFIKERSEAEWIVHNATAGPYMAVVSVLLFNSIIDMFLKKPDNIAGVVVFDNTTFDISTFSPDSKCPNEYSSAPESTCSHAGGSKWNKGGTDLMRTDIPFPIIFLAKTHYEQVEKIEQCYEKFNVDKTNQKGYPLCSVQISSFMYAAVDTATCLKRSAASVLLPPARVCDPLGGRTVTYSLFPRAKETKSTKKPVILVTARMDAASLFDGLSPGASSAVVGLVTLITAAVTLSQMIPMSNSKSFNYNVLWTLLTGESFDYIASQRIAYDMLSERWPSPPLSPADIPLHIEIGQIGGALLKHKDEEIWPLNIFAPISQNNIDKISDVVNEFKSNANKKNLTVSLTSTNNLPPSSLHSFRRILKNFTDTGAIAELLIVDHNEEFTNMYYNSVIDGSDKIGYLYHNVNIGDNGTFVSTDELIAEGIMKSTEPQVKISKLATATAQTLYKKVTGEQYSGNQSASAHMVDELLYCFLNTSKCPLLKAANFGSGYINTLPDMVAPLYVGVAGVPNFVPIFAGHILVLLTGTHLSVNRTVCNNLENDDFLYYWLKGWNNDGVCIESTVNSTETYSPAFEINGYNFKSGEYSTWTESVWREMWARVYVSASGKGATAAAICGLAATVLAAFVTYWLRSRADSIFMNAPTSPEIDAATTGILRTVNC